MAGAGLNHEPAHAFPSARRRQNLLRVAEVIMRRCAALPSSPARPGSSVANSCRCCSTTAISRRSSSLSRRPLATPHPKLQQGIVAFDQLKNFVLPPVDDFYCCLGTTMRDAGSREAFREVDSRLSGHDRANGACRGRDALLRSSPRWAPIAASRVFYNRVKGELEEELMRLELRTVYAFRPSLLAGQRTQVRLARARGACVRAAAIVPAAAAHPPDRRRRRRARDARVRQALRRGAGS